MAKGNEFHLHKIIMEKDITKKEKDWGALVMEMYNEVINEKQFTGFEAVKEAIRRAEDIYYARIDPFARAERKFRQDTGETRWTPRSSETITGL